MLELLITKMTVCEEYLKYEEALKVTDECCKLIENDVMNYLYDYQLVLKQRVIYYQNLGQYEDMLRHALKWYLEIKKREMALSHELRDSLYQES